MLILPVSLDIISLLPPKVVCRKYARRLVPVRQAVKIGALVRVWFLWKKEKLGLFL